MEQQSIEQQLHCLSLDENPSSPDIKEEREIVETAVIEQKTMKEQDRILRNIINTIAGKRIYASEVYRQVLIEIFNLNQNDLIPHVFGYGFQLYSEYKDYVAVNQNEYTMLYRVLESIFKKITNTQLLYIEHHQVHDRIFILILQIIFLNAPHETVMRGLHCINRMLTHNQCGGGVVYDLLRDKVIKDFISKEEPVKPTLLTAITDSLIFLMFPVEQQQQQFNNN